MNYMNLIHPKPILSTDFPANSENQEALAEGGLVSDSGCSGSFSSSPFETVESVGSPSGLPRSTTLMIVFFLLVIEYKLN